MFRGQRGVGLVAALIIVGTFAQRLATAQRSADAQSRIVGSWRILSYELEFQDNGERRPTMGAHPSGYLVFLSTGRMMAYLEADGRRAPKTDEERVAAYRTIIAYTGKYRVQGDKWITKVEGAWNVDWSGTDQERSYTLNGDRLDVVAQWNRNALYGGRMTRGHLTFERET